MAAPIAHGGGLIAARRYFPHAPEPWIDLSTGINPVAYPVPPIPPHAFTRLPEPEQVTALEAAAAQAYGVANPAAIVAAPGTQALIHQLPRLIAPGTVSVLAPTYAEHRAAWEQAGHIVSEVSRLDEAAVVVVVRPNNPDGRLVDTATLLALADRQAAQGGLLVVDEAFADLEDCTLAPHLPRLGMLLLRSFGKTYGLAGLRLGFALGDPALVALLRQALGPWAVSGPALWAGMHALPDASWRSATAGRLAADAARLDTVLQQAGCRIVGGTRLFRLAEHNRAPDLADQLGQAGILVRRFAERPCWLRFGLPGTPAEWERLHAAIG